MSSSVVECQECENNFPTFKVYIKHIITKECKGRQNEEEDTNCNNQPENKRLKVSPKLFTKKRKFSQDSTSGEKALATLSSELVFNPRNIDMQDPQPGHTSLEKPVKKTIMQNINSRGLGQNETADVVEIGVQIEGNLPNAKAAKKHESISKSKTGSQINGKVRCSLCEKMVKSRGMTQHLNLSHKCKYCGEMFDGVDQHISNVHEVFICEFCSVKFTEEALRYEHVQEKHRQKCLQCEDEFSSEENLKTHTTDVHESEECDQCNTKFLIADKMLDEHRENAHGIKPRIMKQFSGGMFMMVSD